MNWKTILMIILIILLVLIIAFGGWSYLLASLSSMFPSMTATQLYLVAIAIVATITVGLLILAAVNPEWLDDVVNFTGESIEKLSSSLGKAAGNITGGAIGSLFKNAGGYVVAACGLGLGSLFVYNKFIKKGNS